MKIAIVGPGAIGCILSSMLTKTNNDICLIDKNPKRANFISQNGIRIEGTTEPVLIKTYSNITDITGHVDYLCICVKSYDTSSAIRDATPLIEQNTTIVSFQNGLGNAEKIVTETGHHKVLCAVTSHGATLLDTGHIRHAGTGSTTVAPFSNNLLSSAHAFAEILSNAGIHTTCKDNLAATLWSKVVINAAINPITAAWNVPNGEIIKHPELKAIAIATVNEAAQVAAAQGIHLFYNEPENELLRICNATENNISSMLQDIRNNKKTEINEINGAIIKAAIATQINTPRNKTLLDKINAIQHP